MATPNPTPAADSPIAPDVPLNAHDPDEARKVHHNLESTHGQSVFKVIVILLLLGWPILLASLVPCYVGQFCPSHTAHQVGPVQGGGPSLISDLCANINLSFMEARRLVNVSHLPDRALENMEDATSAMEKLPGLVAQVTVRIHRHLLPAVQTLTLTEPSCAKVAVVNDKVQDVQASSVQFLILLQRVTISLRQLLSIANKSIREGSFLTGPDPLLVTHRNRLESILDEVQGEASVWKEVNTWLERVWRETEYCIEGEFVALEYMLAQCVVITMGVTVEIPPAVRAGVLLRDV